MSLNILHRCLCISDSEAPVANVSATACSNVSVSLSLFRSMLESWFDISRVCLRMESMTCLHSSKE